ncbi:MAG TPA: cell envelope integrity protein CreD [Bacteroidota bacterium]|nr:cell envelope integrity protein CreD [Bacteroidota bacterium]
MMNESMLRNSVILRMFIVAVMTLMLLVPTILIQDLISDRQQTREAAMNEISQGWGGNQSLTGPVLNIPYKEPVDTRNGAPAYAIRIMHVLPSRLTVHSSIAPEIRYRGIYEVGLYNAQTLFEGEFPPLVADQFGVVPENIAWRDAFITCGISDLKGIRDTVSIRFNQSAFPSKPGVLSNEVSESGITFMTPIEHSDAKQSFSLQLSLNGSSEIRFAPVGEVTQVSVESPWNNPSFIGNYLPDSRDISANGFHANWKVLNLNRNFPQMWTGKKFDVAGSAFGIRLFLPVDEYQKTSRTVKYAILFIALTFVAFFLSEVVAKVILHPIQYALIGLALVVFYVLLLSISEHISFNIAYGIASCAVIGLITTYSQWVTASKKIASVIASVLVLLYSFLFVTLQLQDYALLLGSLGLFIILLVIMYLTRKVDWFGLGKIQRREQATSH